MSALEVLVLIDFLIFVGVVIFAVMAIVKGESEKVFNKNMFSYFVIEFLWFFSLLK